MSLSGNIAHAQITSNAADLKKGSHTYAYIFSGAAQRAMLKIGVYWDKLLDIQQDCRGRYNVTPVRLRILSPINLPDKATHPIAGAWQVSFKFERCGQDKVYNAVFISNNGAIPKVKPYFPGISLANSKLINDALQSAYAAASEQITDSQCQDMSIYDMKVLKPPHKVIANGKRVAGVWDETWSFLGCGQVVGVHMTFVPDGRGNVQFNARPMKPVHKVEPLPKLDNKKQF
jgi:hypothetical protein